MLTQLSNEITFLKKSTKFEKLKEQNKVIFLYSECDEDDYPILKSLYQILLTLPISAATAERSFSSLRRLKTWLRANMREDRLTGLALIYIHRQINVDFAKIINRFANLKNRRVQFLLH